MLINLQKKRNIAFFKALHNFFFVKIDPFVLGLYRIFLGLYLLLFYFMIHHTWLRFYGQNGITFGRIKDISDYELFDSLLLFISSDTGLWIFYAISVICAICLVFGVLWKVPVIWLWTANYSVIYGNAYISNSEDQVMAVLLFFSIFLPLNSSMGLWTYLGKSKKKSEGKVTIWALRPLQIHLALIYLFSIPHKLISDFAWRDGTVIHYLQHNSLYSRWPDLNVFTWGNAFLSRVMTLYTIVVQSIFPFLAWFRRFTVPLVLGSIFLHLGIAFLIEGITMFNLAMIVGLILFLPSRKTRIFFTKLTKRLKKWLKK